MILRGQNISNFKSNIRRDTLPYSKILSFQKKRYNVFQVSSKFFSQTSEESPKKDVSGRLPRVYEASSVESGWCQWWEQEGFFKLQPSYKSTCNSKPFTMILPPPNITGSLHLGHALTATIQDIVARWKRMCGQDVLWIPGTDHAGIATQVVVEKQLRAFQNISRHELGRENFIKEILKWQNEKGSHIQNQLRLMGASLDWSKEYFTMDKTQSQAVVEAFIRLFEEGLIYRSDVPVSWSCWLQSTISSIEIDNHEIDGPTDLQVPGYEKPIQFGTLTNIAYKCCENEDEIVVSTTRPETVLGDVAIAVHPDDPRYSHLHGSFFWHPYRQEKIPLICDDFVEREFGTGAVKITPAHDRTDFDVAKKHNLKQISVINEDGAIHDNFEPFKGIKRFIAREHILNDLASRGLLKGQSPHKMIIPMCGRSGDVVELMPKSQWFLSTKDMSQEAIMAVKENHLRITPKRAEQQWYQWFENNQDWCLSRQLWWGHRIPAYKCSLTDGSSYKWFAAESELDAKVKASSHFACQSNDSRLVVLQDEDVLDTWFSSSILPFSSVGWPEKEEELKKLYPLSLMETGNDILLFWVARMVILGLHLTHQLPFKDVFLHGVIRDGSGKKMSKSVGNVVAPEDIREGRSIEELIERVVASHKSGVIPLQELKNAIRNQKQMFPKGIPQCGTDALRLALCSHPIESHFIDFDVQACSSFCRFCNKIWQACRYIEGVMEESDNSALIKIEDKHLLGVMDLWILSKLSTLIFNLDDNLSKMSFHTCVQELEIFVHNEFCNVYLETTKFLWNGNNTESNQIARSVLATCIENILILLSPFMPFITEELYHRIPYIEKKNRSISLCPYPQPDQWLKWRDESLEKEVDFILLAVTAIRKLKNNNGLKATDKVSVILSTKSDSEKRHFLLYKNLLETLSSSHISEIDAYVENLSNDFMTEERLSDNCVIKIILQDENQKLLSEKQKCALFTLALKKRIKLREEISKSKKALLSPKFLKNALKDVRETLSVKVNIMEEELKKNEAFLDQEPQLKTKLEQILNEMSLKKRK